MPDQPVIILCVLLAGLAGCAPTSAAGEPVAPEPAVTQPEEPQAPPAAAETDSSARLEATLAELNQNLLKLQSCRLELSWRFFQPLLETSTVRTGVLYYRKSGSRSYLRINFSSFRENQDTPQPLREEIIFDGIWLTRIDYQLKEIKRDQLAPEGEPLDAFQLLTGRIPIVSFSNIENLRKQFEVTLESVDDPNGLVHLVLLPRPDSDYAGDYRKIDILTGATEALPQRISAVTTDGDLNEIVLKKAGPQEVNDSAFSFERPRDFTVISRPLKAGEK
jgi:outer membrane lipoprotein-sorting protein